MADEQENLDEKVMIDDETVTLAELLGISMDDVEERRSEALPKGVFLFELDHNNPPKLAVVGGDNARKAAAVFTCIVKDVVAVNDPEFKSSPDTLIGKKHTEVMFITSLDSLGYIKAFLKDIGAPYDKDLKKFLFNSAGTRFQGTIGKRHNKDDKDIVYTNIIRDRAKLKPSGQSDKVPETAAA